MLLARGITTPDGTTLVSSHRHDCKVHKDKNGELYMIDCGPEYIRMSGVAKVFEITTDDDWSVIRHYYRDGWIKTARLEELAEPWRTKEANYRELMKPL